jgi:eukaryotic-like serine/threonine-protein kinase
MRLKPGDTFDRYSIEALLGEGGMGVVYRAMDAKLMRRVALKVLRGAKTDADTWGRAVARMLREARSAAALNHPNAVAIYDVGESDGAPYLAMELIEGTPLRRYVGADIAVGTRLRWLCDVARALSAAHRAGLVHRDIKPENVILRDDGVIKVLDFGIARSVRLSITTGEADTIEAVNVSTITGQGALIGTPAYMAPEQIRGDPLDGRADQFSWGVLAYELLSGRLPFGAGRDPVGMLASVLTEKEKPLEDLPELRDLPEGAGATVHRALAKSADDRFESMDAIVEELVSLRAWTPEADIGPTSGPRSASGLSRQSSDRFEKADSRERGAHVQRTSSPSGSGRTIATPAPQRRRGWPIAIAACAGLSLAIIVAVSRRQGDASSMSAAASSASASSPSNAAPVPTPITELPPPKTDNPEALAAYREGIQGFRDAGWWDAHASFERAVKLDPRFAAAYLRLAMTTRYLGTPAETREAFQKAIQLRALLSERDQALLDALEPRLYREPSDNIEAFRRLEAAHKRFPGDAELLSLLTLGNPSLPHEAQLDIAERCIALDPAYADCWQSKAGALSALQRLPEARIALDRCLSISPAAHDCLESRMANARASGRCDLMEEDARSMIVRTPHSSLGYENLAIALFARGRPLAAVRSALEQAWLRTPENVREKNRRFQEARLSFATGRFADAEESSLKYLRDAKLDPSSEAHLVPAALLIDIYKETGRLKDAGRIAAETLAGLDAWLRPIEASIYGDPTITLLDAQRRAKMISDMEFEARRAAWLGDVDRKYPDRPPGSELHMAYAWTASTPEEAKEALTKIPDLGQMAPFMPRFLTRTAVGKLYWLAGNWDQALPYLRAATAECGVLIMPAKHIQAQHQLGVALAEKGDKEGACAAWKGVLSRWGEAKDSITAKASAARMKALGCGT